MADDDLEKNLDRLRAFLGRDVALRSQEEITTNAALPTAGNVKAEQDDWEKWHEKSAEANITWGKDDCPKREIERNPPLPHVEHSHPIHFDESGLRVGEPTREGTVLCPWKAVLSYPDRYIGKTNRPRARPFFSDILSGRVWNFFYLHDPRWPDQKPFLFVPTAQFVAFLGEINERLGTELTIPPGVNQQKFCFNFDSGGTPQPRYLARSENKRSMDQVLWPAVAQSDVQGFNNAPREKQDAFLQVFKRLFAPPSTSKSEKAQERAQDRARIQQAMMHHAQMQLGLLEEAPTLQVVFVCIDLEALEGQAHIVSEVGIAILDTNDIRTTDPGPSGSKWWPFISCHHLRTEEYSDMRNHQYVQGCPDAFDFGTSSFPKMQELASTVASILSPYTDRGRDMMFVAHDTKQDIKFLLQIGVDIMAWPRVVGEIDTAVLHQKWRDGDTKRSLRALLSDLCIENRNLHNAGNDAMYTLRAMIGIAAEQLRKVTTTERGEKYVPALWLESPRWESGARWEDRA